ncbi:hypothetical protein OG689_17710 [Kitasatospora sp. NBC_00240]|uniref:hypothetical protein n=1 Tax=Kitasatospora sp. NBC_00240 TaxID=2903567 RepID=UPI002252F60E|nr:hypothetical protein [Kitasatospora sp. NBC_00240]MCX5211105.1 hypothetical protein [Kitasatospora sp. NBC_00240]
MRSLRRVRRLRRTRVVRLARLGRRVGTAGAVGVLISMAGPAHAEGSEPGTGVASSPAPASAEFAPVLSDSVGGDAGLVAVGGGLVVVAGGAALWLKRRRSGVLEQH